MYENSDFLLITFSYTKYFVHSYTVDLVFTPQPFGLEGYCRHGSGGRVGGRAAGRAAAKLAEPISL